MSEQVSPQRPGVHRMQLPEREPAFADAARAVTITQPVKRDDPMPLGVWNGTTAAMFTPRLKASVWGLPGRLTMSLGKTDVWDRRKGWEPPLTIREIREGCFAEINAPEQGKAWWSDVLVPEGGSRCRYPSWAAYDFPCPKPVGQIILLCPDLSGAAQPDAVISCTDGTARVRLANGGASANLRYLLSMERNIIAVSGEFAGLTAPLAVRVFRHQDTCPHGGNWQSAGGRAEPARLEGYDYAADSEWNQPFEPPCSGHDGRFFWIRQRFPAEKTFPNGFEYVLVGLLADQQPSMDAANGLTGLGTVPPPDSVQASRWNEMAGLAPNFQAMRSAPGAAATAELPQDQSARFTGFFTIVTSAETGADLLAVARQRLSEAAGMGFAALAAENDQWFSQLYERREQGRIFFGDPDGARMQVPGLFQSWPWGHGGRCRPDPYRFETDASYSYMEQDWSPWHGMPCFNELYYTRVAVANRTDTLGYLAKIVPYWLDAARKNARDVFGLPGMYMATGYLPPIVADEYAHTTSVWEYSMEIPATNMKILWDLWDYTGDEAYLATQVYPALRELAIFYAAFVTKQDDGLYHAIPSVTSETWGWTYRWERNCDNMAALVMIKWTLRRAAEVAGLLHADPDLSARWLEVADHLAPYPTCQTPEGLMYTDVPGVNPIDTFHNFYPGVMPTILGDEITLDSDREQIEMAVRGARHVRGWENWQVFHLLGQDPCLRYSPNWSWDAKQKTTKVSPIDSEARLREAIVAAPERLLNSRSGRIHLFPCVPDGATLAFRELQARGGFLVSAERINGQTTLVRVIARRSIPCRIMNPWTGKAVTIKPAGRRGHVKYELESERGECLVFSAQCGETYDIVRATR